MLHDALQGLLAGFVATAAMTSWETLFYKRYGLEAALDWHINQGAVSKFNGRAVADNLVAGLAIHFAVGASFGAAFAVVVARIGASALFTALACGVALWCATLAARKPFTGLSPFRGPLGAMPALASFVGHVVYGGGLGLSLEGLRALTRVVP